jgi:hypothetical protein
MPELGSTYRCNLPPRHIWIIISKPADHNDQFVFVNLTSYTDSSVDEECILEPHDFPQFITHETTAAYSHYHLGNVLGIDELLQNGSFIEIARVPPATLQKIINGAHETDQIPDVLKAMLPPKV